MYSPVDEVANHKSKELILHGKFESYVPVQLADHQNSHRTTRVKRLSGKATSDIPGSQILQSMICHKYIPSHQHQLF